MKKAIKTFATAAVLLTAIVISAKSLRISTLCLWLAWVSQLWVADVRKGFVKKSTSQVIIV